MFDLSEDEKDRNPSVAHDTTERLEDEERRLALPVASFDLDVTLQVKLTIVAVFQETAQAILERAEIQSGLFRRNRVRAEVDGLRHALDRLARFADWRRFRGGLLNALCGKLVATLAAVSYTHLTLPTTPYV